MAFLQMSVSGAVMILGIMLVRVLTLERVPKKTFLFLWDIVLARLLLPVSLPFGWSIWSLLGRKTQVPTIGAPVQTVPDVLPEAVISAPGVSTGASRTLPVLEILWLVGFIFCTAFFVVTYLKCRREFRMSFPVENEFVRQWLAEHPLRRKITIRQSGAVRSPLTFGVLHPVILVPKKTNWEDEDALRYVLAHEFVHIRRFDAVTKLLLTAAVCVHWFNPLVWVMYTLANRDIELSCDEAVIRQFGRDTRAAYAMTLIRMEEVNSGFAPLGSYFSKNPMEERITTIMKMRKATMTSLALAAVLVSGTATAFAASAPVDGKTSARKGIDTLLNPLQDGIVKPFQESLDRLLNTIGFESDSKDETIMSYLDPDDGRTYYSFNDGKTFEPLTDAEFEQLFPTQDVEWWTYDEYKAWFENEKVNLQSMIGTECYTNTDGWFVWTQEKVDETITLYENILEDIKNGKMYSKSVDGDDSVMMMSFDPADIEQGKD